MALFLSLVTDAYSRRTAGHHVYASLHAAACRLPWPTPWTAPPGRQWVIATTPTRAVSMPARPIKLPYRQVVRRYSMTGGYDCYRQALAERVDGILKDEFLFLLLNALAQARLLVQLAVQPYNEERPQLAPNYLLPNQVHQQVKSPAGKSERGSCLIPVNI